MNDGRRLWMFPDLGGGYIVRDRVKPKAGVDWGRRVWVEIQLYTAGERMPAEVLLLPGWLTELPGGKALLVVVGMDGIGDGPTYRLVLGVPIDSGPVLAQGVWGGLDDADVARVLEQFT